MKKITYQIEGYISIYNFETEKEEQQLTPATVVVECKTQSEFDTQYSLAKERAIGEIIVEGEFEPEPGLDVWGELDSAYASGINSI